jgi:hypothetical protein
MLSKRGLPEKSAFEQVAQVSRTPFPGSKGITDDKPTYED